MEAIVGANRDHAVGYGDDPWTGRAVEALRGVFGPTAEPFLVFNGTGANSIALQAVTRPFNSIVCAATAHIHVDECGAPAKMTGCQLSPIETPDGKLTSELIAPLLHTLGVEHHPQPGVAYISQTTEMGTVYTIEEIRELADFLHSHGMYLHMDGARLSNAAAALGCTPREMTVDAGVDVLSVGGTKNGMMMGEAVVAFRPEIARNMKYIRKQSAQLASKMRYLSAQWLPWLEDGGDGDGPLWLALARHANEMAARLAGVLARVPGARFTQPVESNQIFCILPPDVLARIREKYFFYMWNETTGEARFVTSWDTSPQDIDDFESKLLT
jgi:threonine aldolase